MKLHTALLSAAAVAIPVGAVVACASSPPRGNFDDPQADGGVDLLGEAGTGFETGGGSPCAQAAGQKAYVGCDYWPTVTGNLVQDVFDFAVAVANVGTE